MTCSSASSLACAALMSLAAACGSPRPGTPQPDAGAEIVDVDDLPPPVLFDTAEQPRWVSAPPGEKRVSRWTVDHHSLWRTRPFESTERIAGTGALTIEQTFHGDFELTLTKEMSGSWRGAVAGQGVMRKTCSQDAATWRFVHFDWIEVVNDPAVSLTVASNMEIESLGPRVYEDRDSVPTFEFRMSGDAEEARMSRGTTVTVTDDDGTHTHPRTGYFTCSEPVFPAWRIKLQAGTQDFYPGGERREEDLYEFSHLTLIRASGPTCSPECSRSSQCLRERCDPLLGCLSSRKIGRCQPDDQCMAGYCNAGICEVEGEKPFVECEEQLWNIYAQCSQLRDWMIEMTRSDRPQPTLLCADADCAGAIAANSRANAPFTSISFSSDAICRAENPAVCEVNCYGWQRP